ncbi:hypothetical protein [Devriesea agamarum]|uniref:hypothetical protein n=1 Tax=Devriesea agamarum TaxID=472569 RepID=UPI00071DE0EE|nr:hypothetical protein [Devriesea agamarum]
MNPESQPHEVRASADVSAGASSTRDVEAADGAARLRRTRQGHVLVGPSFIARVAPALLIGVSTLALLLAPPVSSVWELLRRIGMVEGWVWVPGVLGGPFENPWWQMIAAWIAIWVFFAIIVLLTMGARHRVIVLDPATGCIQLRGLIRTKFPRGNEEVVSAQDVICADADARARGSAIVTLCAPDAHPPYSDPTSVPAPSHREATPTPENLPRGYLASATVACAMQNSTTWAVPHIGWDDASWNGLRMLQRMAGQPISPARRDILARDLAQLRCWGRYEGARQAGMPWLPEYESDAALFQADFDAWRRGERSSIRTRAREDA